MNEPSKPGPNEDAPEESGHWDELIDILGAEPADDALAQSPEPDDASEPSKKKKPKGQGPKRTKTETSPNHWHSVLDELGLESDALPEIEPEPEQIRAESTEVEPPAHKASEEDALPAWDLTSEPPKSFWGDEPAEPQAAVDEAPQVSEERETEPESEERRPRGRGRRRERDRDDEKPTRSRRRRGGRRRDEATEAPPADRDSQQPSERVVEAKDKDDESAGVRDEKPPRDAADAEDSERGRRGRGARRRGGRRDERDRSRRPRSRGGGAASGATSGANVDDVTEDIDELEADIEFESDLDLAEDEDQVEAKESGRRPRSARQVPSWQEAIGTIVDSNLASRSDAPRQGSRGGRRRRPPRDRRD